MPRKPKTPKGETPQGQDTPKPGRPSLYNPDLIETICDRLETGEPLAAICREEGMPAYRTVKDWQDETGPDGQLTERASFVSAAIARAREAGEDALAAECLAIADDGTNDYVMGKNGPVLDSEHVQRSKLRIETRLKLLAKFNPKRWGDKVQLADADGEKLPAAPQFIFAPVAPAPRDPEPDAE